MGVLEGDRGMHGCIQGPLSRAEVEVLLAEAGAPEAAAAALAADTRLNLSYGGVVLEADGTAEVMANLAFA